MDVDDGRSQRLTDHRMTAWPQWSPDGTQLAFQARDESAWSLRLLALADGRERDVTQVADAMPSRPLWSPDGAALLYQSLIGTRFELTRLVFPTDATGAPDYDAAPRRIATTTGYPIDLGAATQHPAWSPADGRLAFVMYTLDVVPPGVLVFTYKTWTLTANGTEPRRLVPSGTHADRSPTWSADGSWLAQWSWNDDLHSSVWLVNAAATRRIDLTADLGGDALYPSWSPDGRTVAFASNRAGNFDIWIADVADLTKAEAPGVVAPGVVAHRVLAPGPGVDPTSPSNEGVCP
jgi:Tol biopolymer transport system component